MEDWNSNDWQGRSRENVEGNYSRLLFAIILILVTTFTVVILKNY